MTLKEFLEEAYAKGETLKEEITSEILNSKVFGELIRSDLFSKAVSTVVKTRDEVARVIRLNVKAVLAIMDVPTRHDLTDLKRKLDHLEKMVDRVGKKAITVRSLKRISLKKAARKK